MNEILPRNSKKKKCLQQKDERNVVEKTKRERERERERREKSGHGRCDGKERVNAGKG